MDTSRRIIEGPLPGIPGALVHEVPFLPEHLPGGRVIGPYTEALPGALQFEVPGIGRFLIHDGTTIEVWVAPGADQSAVRGILLGSAVGTLIHQRGELALLATAMVAPSGAGVAICGSSAIGKSTLAAALSRRGWFLLADGITRVTTSSSGGIAWASGAKLQLWRDACEALNLDVGELEPVRANLEKYFVPVPATPVPTPLDFAVRLQVATDCRVIELSPADRPELFVQSTFRPRQLDALGLRSAHARAVGQVCRNCRAMILEGARDRSAAELADVLSRALT
jgi:hypothetical protein